MSLAGEGPQPFFEDVVDHMAENRAVALAVVVLAGAHRQWVSGVNQGKGGEVDTSESFDALRLLGADKLVVNDTAGHSAFPADSVEALRSQIRAYIAQPLELGDEVVGHVYLADVTPREWTAADIAYLERSARLMVAHVEAQSMIAEHDRRIGLERELAGIGALYLAMFEHLREAVTVMDSSGRIVASNPAASKVLGLTQDQLNGRTPMNPGWRFTDDAGRSIPNDQNIALDALRTGEARIGVVQGVNLPSGEMRWMLVNSVPIRENGSETPTKVVNTFRDISDERARDAKLMEALSTAEAAAESKQKFLADMSHEIRTPLNGVVGLAQALKSTELNAEQEDLVDTILDSGATLTAILNDVLDMSKIDAGKFDIVPSEHDVAEFVGRLSHLWKPRAQEKGLQLRVDFAGSIPERLAFDGVRVQQCLNNLISNAVKFTQEGEVVLSIASSVQADGDHLVTIEVSDTGPGMDAETLGRLFEAFTQANERIAGEHGGTGLGLSITRKLAELMGGEAGATSVKGEGSTFHFSFRASPPPHLRKPAPEPDQSSSEASEDAKADSGKLKVLVVDDNAVNRKVAVLFLKPLGAEVVQAADGQEALEAMEAERFDVVLLDMHMPVLDGPGAIARIRASGEDWATTPVIAVTADAMFGDKERYLALGLDAYLPKPLNAGDLLAEIRRVMEPDVAGEVRAAG